MSRVVKNSDHLFFALPVRRRPACAFTNPPTLLPPHLASKSLSTSSCTKQDDLAVMPSEQPRWKAPPIRTVTRGARNRPFRLEHVFEVNEDLGKLDEVLARVLGRDGDQMLTDEVKWLTVTHKSFDHGRRGFNDRLAYLGMWRYILGFKMRVTDEVKGKRIIDLQASLHMIAGSAATPEHPTPDRWGREPFRHPVLEGLAGLTLTRKQAVLNKTRMAQLASKYGLTDVLRWKPKLVRSMEA